MNVEVAYNARVVWLPETDLEPLHAPDAVHDVARLLDQLSVLVPPELTVPGLAVIVTVGARR